MIKDFDCDISIALQTNGTLINDEWIKHFRKWGIRPGLSFDGLNNSNTRRNTEQLLRVFDKLKQADMDSGSIMVITRDSINNLIDEYEYQKKLGIYSQWNLIFE
jgi:sulfatase maturation enzyme AslB (radical SAM superfamily)